LRILKVKFCTACTPDAVMLVGDTSSAGNTLPAAADICCNINRGMHHNSIM